MSDTGMIRQRRVVTALDGDVNEFWNAGLLNEGGAKEGEQVERWLCCKQLSRARVTFTSLHSFDVVSGHVHKIGKGTLR